MADLHLTANGQAVTTAAPCTLEEFLLRQGLLPRSVVVELNGEAVAPSEFAGRPLAEALQELPLPRRLRAAAGARHLRCLSALLSAIKLQRAPPRKRSAARRQ